MNHPSRDDNKTKNELEITITISRESYPSRDDNVISGGGNDQDPARILSQKEMHLGDLS